MKKKWLVKMQLTRETLRSLDEGTLPAVIGLTCSVCRPGEISRGEGCSQPCSV